jgi:uncharacterized membrane protein YqiK
MGNVSLIVIGVLSLIAVWFLIFKVLGLRIIGSNEIGIVEKWWSTKGSLDSELIALNGEAGFQPDILRGGIHFRSVFMYKVHIAPLVTIPQGQIGYVFARDGQPLDPTQTLGKVVGEANNFQNVREFINNGGQKGPQRGIIREGVYAFNLAQFIVITENKTFHLHIGNNAEKETIENMANYIRSDGGFQPVIIHGEKDLIGIVTINDGPSLSNGEIIAPIVGDNNDSINYHNNFQSPEKFLSAGGFRGRQYQVLTDGVYYINRLFATVELIPKITIPVGSVGVVISYIGAKGNDSSGETYKHGELVENGFKGVWKDPLMPGKYAFNKYAGTVINVPTTNIILKWNSTEVGTHRYDENLKEVGLITKDAFEPSLPLSVVMHIDYRKAPLVIQRFGDIKMLVDQTLDPMIASYFKNVGQTKTLIQLIHERTDIQENSTNKMKEKFDHYNLELEEVLIGTPSASENDKNIEIILRQLRERQIATEQIATYDTQQKAAEKEKALREAEAIAKQQNELTQSHIYIEIETNKGKAEYQKSLQDASKIKALAEAEGSKIKMLAEAEAEREARVGIGKAIAIDEQVRAYGGPQYQITQEVMKEFSQAIKEGKINIVPQSIVTMGGNGTEGGYNAFEALLNVLLSKELGASYTNNNNDNKHSEAEEMRKKIMDTMRTNTTQEVSTEEKE